MTYSKDWYERVEYITRHSYEIFDALPPLVRKAIKEGPFPVNIQDVYDALIIHGERQVLLHLTMTFKAALEEVEKARENKQNEQLLSAGKTPLS